VLQWTPALCWTAAGVALVWLAVSRLQRRAALAPA